MIAGYGGGARVVATATTKEGSHVEDRGDRPRKHRLPMAKNLTTGGQKVIVADTTLAKAENLAGELGSNAEAMSVADAIAKADVVIPAIYFDAIKQLVATYRGALAGKIIVDPSNPIAPDGKGGFKKTIPADQSSGQLLSALVPDGAQLVKAFGTLSAESLASGANRSPERACRERILPDPRRRHRQVDSHRGGRRPARVREARQARIRQRGSVADLIEVCPLRPQTMEVKP